MAIKEFIISFFRSIFSISFSFYLFFWILELIKPGFVTNFFYLNIILLICAISSFFTVILSEKKIFNKAVKKSYVKIFFAIILGGFIFMLILNRNEISPSLDFIILMSALFGFVLSVTLYIFNKKE